MMWPSQRLADKYLGTPGAHVGPSPGLSSSPSRKLRPLQRTYADYRGSGPLPPHVFSYRLPSTHHIMFQFHMHRRMTIRGPPADLSASAPSSAPVQSHLIICISHSTPLPPPFLPSRYTCPRRPPPPPCMGTIPFRVPTDIPPLKQIFALQVWTYEGTRGARS